MAVDQIHRYRLTCDLCGTSGPVIETWWSVNAGWIRNRYHAEYGWCRKRSRSGQPAGKLMDVCASCSLGQKHRQRIGAGPGNLHPGNT